MSDFQSTPPGIDQEMYRLWLEMQGMAPDGTPLPPGSPMPMPDPIDLPNDAVDDLGGWMTDISKGSRLGTNPDYLIQNNLPDYGAYDPITTMEQVSAPGRRTLDQWAASGNPLQSWLAGVMSANGNDPMATLVELQKVVAEGDEGEGAGLLEYIPRSLDPATPDALDLVTVRNELQSLSDLVRTEQDFVSDGQGGYLSSSTEDSPMRQALLDAGYVNIPGEAYDPWTLAPEGVTPESERAIYDNERRADVALYGVDNPMAGTFGGDRIGGAQPRMVNALRDLNNFKGADEAQAAMGKYLDWQKLSDFDNREWSPHPNADQRSTPSGSQPNRALDGSQDGMLGTESVNWSPTNYEPEGYDYGDNESRQAAPQRRKLAGPRPPEVNEGHLALQRAVQRGLGEQFAKADKAAGKAQQDHIGAMTSLNRSASGIRQREAMAKAMLAAGFSPFDDERRNRNQSIYGR